MQVAIEDYLDPGYEFLRGKVIVPDVDSGTSNRKVIVILIIELLLVLFNLIPLDYGSYLNGWNTVKFIMILILMVTFFVAVAYYFYTRKQGLTLHNGMSMIVFGVVGWGTLMITMQSIFMDTGEWNNYYLIVGALLTFMISGLYFLLRFKQVRKQKTKVSSSSRNYLPFMVVFLLVMIFVPYAMAVIFYVLLLLGAGMLAWFLVGQLMTLLFYQKHIATEEYFAAVKKYSVPAFVRELTTKQYYEKVEEKNNVEKR